MSNVPDNVLSKIKKCMALSQSPNEHEAAAALRQAQKLMAAYNVTEEALVGAEVGEEGVNAVVWRQPPEWESRLAHLVSGAFGCKIMITLGRENVLAKWRYFGLKHNVQVAVYTHSVLQRQIVKAREAYMKVHAKDWMSRGEKIKLGESFCRGFVMGLKDKVDAMANPEAVQKVIDDKFALALGPTPKTVKPTARGQDWNAYNSGAAAGKDASLHRPMNGKEVLKLT